MSTLPKKDLPFPLSKIMDPEDQMILEDEMQRLLECDAMAGQHPARWWEYAMAHRAIREWGNTGLPEYPPFTRDPLILCDVGGSGSRFAQSLVGLTSEDITVIDPNLPVVDVGRCRHVRRSVEEYAAVAQHSQFDCLTAISVIEHLDAVRPFIRACHMLLKPGGLLFLTTDCWNCTGPDTAHFHWMRKRIYDPEKLRSLGIGLREIGYSTFGRSDWQYHGDQVYDYSFASLAMVKK